MLMLCVVNLDTVLQAVRIIVQSCDYITTYTCILAAGSLLSSLMFGTGEGPVFRGFRCEGWEQNIGQCYNRTLQYSPTSSGNCDWNDIVAVRCRDCKLKLYTYDNNSFVI